MNNGRIDSLYDTNYNIYNLFKEEQRPQYNFENEAIKGTHITTDISDIFFSKINIDVLQEAIRYQVYIKSSNKHIIDRQSDTDLKVIMRAIYLENTQHTLKKTEVLNEVKRLNSLVINFCVPRIIQEINMYIRYKNDISHLPVPLERGEFSSSKGTKQLITKEF